MVALGSLVRANRELRAAREESARSAVSEERERFAQHPRPPRPHARAIVPKSELATKLVETDPDRALAEVRDIQSVTRQALREMREAVHGYRRRSLAEALEGARVPPSPPPGSTVASDCTPPN